ncbi:MAG: hypothetical protein ABEI96_11250 [Haloarculaceae archaeon]
MSDRIASDNDAVVSHRQSVERIGRTERPQVVLPETAAVAEGDVIRLSLSGTEYHARVETDLHGRSVVRRAAANARLAREREGTDHLQSWVEAADVTLGGSVLVDVVTDGYKYGVRRPGERVVYDATDPPDDSLASLAEDLAEE